MYYPALHWLELQLAVARWGIKDRWDERGSHPGKGLFISNLRCNTKNPGSICHVNSIQSSELSQQMSPSNTTKFTSSIQKKKQKHKPATKLLFFVSFPNLTCAISSPSRQIIRLRATTSKWHFDTCGLRIREHTTNLVDILHTTHITSPENDLSVLEFVRLLISFLSYYTCITIKEPSLSAESLLKNKSIYFAHKKGFQQ